MARPSGLEERVTTSRQAPAVRARVTNASMAARPR